MTASRSRKPKLQQQPAEETSQAKSTLPPPTGKRFLGEEDKRLLKKLNQHFVNKLGLKESGSYKI
jgi:hypothetical protein